MTATKHRPPRVENCRALMVFKIYGLLREDDLYINERATVGVIKNNFSAKIALPVDLNRTTVEYFSIKPIDSEMWMRSLYGHCVTVIDSTDISSHQPQYILYV